VIESDIHPTRDGEIVMFHDQNLERTTNGEGPIAARSLAELERLDAGYRFSPDGGRSFPFRGQGIGIPRLEQAFRAFPGMRFNLELKELAPGFVDAVLDLVRRSGRADITLLAAEKDAIMAEIRRQLSASRLELATSACVGDVMRFVRCAVDGSAPEPGAMALQVPAGFGGRALVTEAFVRHAHAHGIEVHVWTVNDPAEMARLLDLGVDGLITDFPARMTELLERRSA
jgi:glycerophosphoryl diester phosphodiesterase